MVFQDTDGTRPWANATFANFERRTYEVPPIRIEPAAVISVPTSGGVEYIIESAPDAAKGPWLRFVGPKTPGIQTITVPISDTYRFFRAEPAL
jgi:hypothetical protein